MQMTFTKGKGKFDRLDIVTPTGPQPAIDCPKQGIIPHDMVHFAVETEVTMRGFLGGIAASGESGHTAGVEDPHHRAVERLVETVQAEAWSGAPVADADFVTLYHVTCDARGDTPLVLDSATIAAVRHRLVDLTARWAAVPVGGTLVLSLDPARGRAS